MSVQDYGAVITDEEEQELLYPSYQRQVVHIISLEGEQPCKSHEGCLEEETTTNTTTTYFLKSCHYKSMSGILLLALLSFVCWVGRSELGVASFFVVSSEGGEASIMANDQNSWARNTVQRWAHSYPTKSDAVRAKDAHGNKIKATTVIVIKEHNGVNRRCDHEDGCHSEPEPCNQLEKCAEKLQAAPTANPMTPLFHATMAPLPLYTKYPSCSEVAACSHLAGACCPTEQGAFLQCCQKVTSPSVAPVAEVPSIAFVPPLNVLESWPIVAPQRMNASCGAFPSCFGLHLTGDCCPTLEGMFLDCCGQIWEATVPTTEPPSEYLSVSPTKGPTESPTQAPSESPTEEDSSCATFPVCAALQLTGECCPTVGNVYLACCFETSGPSSLPTANPIAISASPVPDSACGTRSACAHLQGDCCPTLGGTFLDCCHGTTAPSVAPTDVPRDYPTWVPSHSHSDLPTPVPTNLPSQLPSATHPILPSHDPASCALHPACADTDGDCCPTKHSHTFLKCCFATDMPSVGSATITTAPPTVAPLAAIVGSPTTTPASFGKGRIHHYITSSKKSKVSKGPKQSSKWTESKTSKSKSKQTLMRMAKWAKAAPKTLKGEQSKKDGKSNGERKSKKYFQVVERMTHDVVSRSHSRSNKLTR